MAALQLVIRFCEGTVASMMLPFIFRSIRDGHSQPPAERSKEGSRLELYHNITAVDTPRRIGFRYTPAELERRSTCNGCHPVHVGGVRSKLN